MSLQTRALTPRKKIGFISSTMHTDGNLGGFIGINGRVPMIRVLRRRIRRTDRHVLRKLQRELCG